jgi:DNA-directed RNA polymerase specialized sigma subunit
MNNVIPTLSAKEYLSQAFRIDQRINAKLEQVENLRCRSTKTTATLSDTSVMYTRDAHSADGIIVKLIDLENEINADIDRLVDLKRDIYEVFRSIHDPELQLLLELRYLCYKNWSEISVALDLDDRYVYKLHGRALTEVEKSMMARAVKDIV